MFQAGKSMVRAAFEELFCGGGLRKGLSLVRGTVFISGQRLGLRVF